ncbi:hypothetical protein ACYCFL_05565 [Stutzerimonas nitrititolerans]|uniref:hypothetical protein n=1 Tax=Stutzerimonas nitrititolerans TaxID=2482751 RepID=UPI0028A0DA6A|nr:hypothetical protein [Stutzerimonas nitrititolerans]
MAMQDYVWWVRTDSETWRDGAGVMSQAHSTMLPIRSDGTVGPSVGYYTPKVALTNGYSYEGHGFPVARATTYSGVPYRVGGPALVLNGEFVTHYAATAKRSSGDNPNDGAIVMLRVWSSKPTPAGGVPWTEEGAPGGGGLSVSVDEQYVLPLALEGSGTSEISSLIGAGISGLQVGLTTMLEWHATNVGWMRTYGECVVTAAGKSTAVAIEPTEQEITPLSGFEVEFEDGSSGSFQAYSDYFLPV